MNTLNTQVMKDKLYIYNEINLTFK